MAKVDEHAALEQPQQGEWWLGRLYTVLFAANPLVSVLLASFLLVLVLSAFAWRWQVISMDSQRIWLLKVDRWTGQQWAVLAGGNEIPVPVPPAPPPLDERTRELLEMHGFDPPSEAEQLARRLQPAWDRRNRATSIGVSLLVVISVWWLTAAYHLLAKRIRVGSDA